MRAGLVPTHSAIRVIGGNVQIVQRRAQF